MYDGESGLAFESKRKPKFVYGYGFEMKKWMEQ
nr:hypothetical protein Iba_scaffold6395CG0060 [Ipomoea batatas]